jgi:hypothetical protein
MRRGYKEFGIIEEDGIFYGISLGWDFCSEHEWGIKDLKRLLGINDSKLGIEGRTITKSDEVIFIKDKKQALLRTKPWSYKPEQKIKDLLSSELYIYDGDGKKIATAWSDDDFGILVEGEKNIALLEELYKNFKKNNIAIASLKGTLPVFSNSSLSLLIKDRLPKEALDSMYNVDKSALDLVEYEKEIGVTALKEKVRGNGYKGEKYFCACSPRWIDYENKENREAIKQKLGTKYDIQFWINYSDDDNNYGWYTAEEIIKWFSTPGLKLTQIRKAN